MIILQDTLISEDVINKEFVCNLTQCKGICCIEGDSGAPVTDDEVGILKNIYPIIKPYLRKESIEAIEKYGTSVTDEDNDIVTPLVNNAECAYVVFDEKNIAKCAIEQAYLDKKIEFKKPISCHLYPIRLSSLEEYVAVNYNQWHICNPACHLGEKMKVPVYKFLKEPLIRRFGEEWYTELEEFVQQNEE